HRRHGGRPRPAAALRRLSRRADPARGDRWAVRRRAGARDDRALQDRERPRAQALHHPAPVADGLARGERPVDEDARAVRTTTIMRRAHTTKLGLALAGISAMTLPAAQATVVTPGGASFLVPGGTVKEASVSGPLADAVARVGASEHGAVWLAWEAPAVDELG